jgi:hypothetical protein
MHAGHEFVPGAVEILTAQPARDFDVAVRRKLRSDAGGGELHLHMRAPVAVPERIESSDLESGISGRQGVDAFQQSLQPLLLIWQKSRRRTCLKNSTTPVSSGEQRISSFRPQHVLEMGNRGVDIAERVGAYARRISVSGSHCMCSDLPAFPARRAYGTNAGI